MMEIVHRIIAENELSVNYPNQGWKNTNTYRANNGVRSCLPEHERTRTRIFRKILNTNSESKNIKYKS